MDERGGFCEIDVVFSDVFGECCANNVIVSEVCGWFLKHGMCLRLWMTCSDMSGPPQNMRPEHIRRQTLLSHLEFTFKMAHFGESIRPFMRFSW